MPWTLYRYILKELLKLLIASTVVLVFAIAMAAAIKPLSEGLLGPIGLLKFVFFTAPTILDIALPFAGAFASTLVFYRMVADHEVVACRACGISYVKLLVPVVMLGVVLASSMLYLSNKIIPSFYRMAAFTVQKDVVRVVVSRLKDGKPFRQKNMVLYADRVGETQVKVGKDKKQTQTIYMLQGVVLAKIDRQGHITSDSTSRRADLILVQKDNQSWVKIRLDKVSHYQGSSQEPWMASDHVEYALAVPNPFRNKIRYLSWSDLNKLKHKPEMIPDINQVREKLIGELACEQVLTEAVKRLKTKTGRGELSLFGMTKEDHYLLRAPKVRREGHRLILDAAGDKRVSIEFYDSGLPRHRMLAKTGVLSLKYHEGVLGFELVLDEVDVIDLRREGRRTQHAHLPAIKPLSWSKPVLEPLVSMSTDALMRHALQPPFEQVTSVNDLVKQLASRIFRQGRQTKALLHKRGASAVASLLILLMGAVFSLMLEGHMPLAIYLRTFGVAAVMVLAIRVAGKALTNVHNPVWLGLLAIWAANLLMVALLAAGAWRVARR